MFFDPFRPLRRKAEGTGEVQIERNQSSAAVAARFVDGFVRATRQLFVAHRVHVVAALGQKRRQSDIKILVKLESHDLTGSDGSGMIRSRVISAANANAARTSSGCSWGYA
jgi:hypothetical protein